MGLLDRLAARFGYVQKGTEYKQLPQWLVNTGNAARYSNLPDLAVAENQAELYQRLSWVATAIDRIAEVFGTVPLEVMRLEGEEKMPVPNHDFERLLMRPNPSQSRYEFLTDFVLFYKTTGNHYIWLNKQNENAPPVEMWTIPAHRIRPLPDGQMYIKGYMYNPGDGKEVPLEPWEVLHIKRTHPKSRYVGLSPIESFATVATGDMKMQEWNTNFFGENNAKLPGILTFAEMMDDAEWERAQADFERNTGGTKRNFMMFRGIGEGAINWVPTVMSQKDMEFLGARDFNRKEIYDLMAPGLTSWLSENSTEANSKTGKEAFIELAVWPLCVSFHEKLSNNLMPLYGENFIAQFDDIRPKDILLDLKREETYSRVHTINEVRMEFYGHDPIDGGDRLPGAAPASVGDVDADNDGEVDTPEQVAQQELEAKAHERDQFHRYASKRVKEGSPEKVGEFKFKYLDLAEQKALKAEYVDDTETLAKRLADLIEVFHVPD